MAPWRIDYIRSLHQPAPGVCFLCQAAATDAAQHSNALILWSTPHTIVLMNRFPYANGHLLVAPAAHQAELDHLDMEQLADLQAQTARAISLLKRAISPQGFNVGINLGRCAGAGVPGHLHQHIVPRWAGDINFMAAIGETHIVPQAVSQLYEELMTQLKKMQS